MYLIIVYLINNRVFNWITLENSPIFKYVLLLQLQILFNFK